MSFFRRLFNNSSDEKSSESELIEKNPAINTSSDQVNIKEASQDNLDTGEIKPPISLQDEVQISADTTTEELEQTLPSEEIVSDSDSEKVDIVTSQDEIAPGVTRPLPSEPIMPISTGHITFGHASDQGMVRLQNQDAVFSFLFASTTAEEFPDFGIFVVADGMGGHQEGEKASAITARVVANAMAQKIYFPMLGGNDMNDVDQPTIVEALVNAVQEANTMVREEVADGGTTLTAIVIRGEAAHIAHVGDSRAYWISSQSEIEQVTRDHSVVQRLIELDQLTPEEAETHEQRNVLYRAVGQNDDVEVEIHRKRLLPDSHMLICSDGLWNMVGNDEILEIVKAATTPQEACEKLVALANTHGGTDNITVTIIKTPAS